MADFTRAWRTGRGLGAPAGVVQHSRSGPDVIPALAAQLERQVAFGIVGGIMATSHSFQQPGGEQQLLSQMNFPEIYEQALVGPLFQPWGDSLLEDVGLRPDDRVLDIACGTGIVARLGKERLGPTGSVVGVDVNPQMLAVARRVAPTIDWRQGDAGALPLGGDEQFDVVLCQQGFQFFQDRAAAARQMRRALASGGRPGISTWRPDDEFPLLRRLREIADSPLRRRLCIRALERHGPGQHERGVRHPGRRSAPTGGGNHPP